MRLHLNYRRCYQPSRRNGHHIGEGFTYREHVRALAAGFDLWTAEGRLLAAIFGY